MIPHSRTKSNTLLNTNMGERGSTIQTVIVSSVMVLAAVLVGIIIYNIIADESEGIKEAVDGISDITLFTDATGEPDVDPREEPRECAEDEIRNDQGECELDQPPECTVTQIRNDQGECEEEVITNSGLPVKGLYSGRDHACAIIGADDSVDSVDTVWCWGDNTYGQFGQATPEVSEIPIKIPRLENIRALSVGHRHACAIIRDSDTDDTEDTAKCWGHNASSKTGQRNTNGNDLTLLPIDIQTHPDLKGIQVLKGVKTISADFSNTCAIAAILDGANEPTDEDTVYCWGSNRRGQLGVVSDRGLNYPPPDLFLWEPQLIEELSGKDLKAVAVGQDFACVIIGGDQTDGSADTVWCWGDNNHNQLGGDDFSPTYSTVPIEIAGLTGAKAITTGARHACVIIGGSNSDGSGDTVKCWGSNDFGELGDDRVGSRFVSAEISDFRGAKSVVASLDTTCIITFTSSYKCVGALARDGADDGANQPEVSFIAPGTNHVCIAYTDDTAEDDTAEYPVKCFGGNSRAQIARAPVNIPYHIPNKIQDTSGAKYISVGGDIGCFITSSDTLKCWGSNSFEQLGLPTGESNNFRIRPREISGLTGVTDISNTYFGAYCAVASKSAQNSEKGVKCRGNTRRGVIGQDPNDPNNPTDMDIMTDGFIDIRGVLNPKTISALYFHACAIAAELDRANEPTGEDAVWCWGWNGGGQLLPAQQANDGLPVYLDPEIQPELVDVKALSAGRLHTCAIAAELDGGDTGNPTGEDTVWCWGGNNYGQLGLPLDKPTPNASAYWPRAIPGLNGVKAISAGRNHNCVITAEDTVKCWGRNNFGQVGALPFDPPNAGAPIAFVDVPGLKRVTAISGGHESTCAIAAVLDGNNNPTSEDAIYCWGDNRLGLLGAPYTALDSPGKVSYSSVPVRIQGIVAPKAVSIGRNQVCAIAADLDVDNNPTGEDAIYCWGRFNFGARGVLIIPGTNTLFWEANDYSAPRQISGL